jgi:type I restriction enzyme S subunit
VTASISFYKETNFQEGFEIGKIPKDWKIVRLGDKIAEVIMGQSPPSNTYNEKGEGLPFLQGKMEFGEIYPSPVMYCSNPIKIAEPGDILISVRAPVGDVNLAPYRLCIGRGLAAIRFYSKMANSRFYFYYLQKVKNFLENLGKGSTFKAVNKDDLVSLKIPLPPLPEQERIVEVLSCVDLAVQKVDEAIARAERLKKGLMQQLLTKGIGHKDFRKVKIAFKEYSIPVSWQVKNLLETSVIKGRIGWHGLKAEEYLENGDYYLVRGTEFENGRVLWEKCAYISQKRYEQDPNIQLREGDILVTKDGSIGKVSFIDKLPKKATLGTGVFVIRPLRNAYLPIYMFYIMQSEFFERFINVLKAGSTLSHLFQKDFTKFEFPLPPPSEQQRIAEMLSIVDNILRLKKKKKEKLVRMKRRLMDLLLTSKVRVTV